MDDVYTEHEVSVKIALYSHDLEHVVVMQYGPDHFGLPGGHLEANELPDEALLRELDEEVGIRIDSFTQAGFYVRSDSKSTVILAYTGVASSDIVLNSPNPEKEVAIWVTKVEVETKSLSDTYKKHVLENWPTNQ